MTSEQPEAVHNQLEAILAEYASLRDEISRRSRYQIFALSGPLVAIASILGFVSGDPTTYLPLFLVVPWVFSVSGIMWLDQVHGIYQIATYIRVEIEGKKLCAILKCDPGSIVGWETYLNTLWSKSRPRLRNPLWQKIKSLDFITFLMPLVYFLSPCIAAFALDLYLVLCTPIGGLPKALGWSFITIDLLLVLAFFYSWRRAMWPTGLKPDE